MTHPGGPDRPLRVASYNVRALRSDVKAAAAVVRALDPDVLCLQEVPRHPGARWRLDRFAARCALVTTGPLRGSGGTAVLVAPSLAPARAEVVRLPVRLSDERRGATVLRLRQDRRRVLVVASVHLSLRDDERPSHLRAVLRAMGEPGRRVVAGDLNERPGRPAWQVLRAAGLVEGSSDDPLPATYPATHPRHRIDVVVTDPALEPVVIPIRLPHSLLQTATDHLPVLVGLRAAQTRAPSS